MCDSASLDGVATIDNFGGLEISPPERAMVAMLQLGDNVKHRSVEPERCHVAPASRLRVFGGFRFYGSLD